MLIITLRAECYPILEGGGGGGGLGVCGREASMHLTVLYSFHLKKHPAVMKIIIYTTEKALLECQDQP